MATRFTTGGSETNRVTGLSFIYTVNTPVGKGADNKKIADNQLVQLFLREFYNSRPALFKKLPKPTTDRTTQSILIDDKVGPQTIVGISVFQKEVIRLGGSAVFQDGVVSVPKGLRVAGTNHIFTIVQLNGFFFQNRVHAPFIENLEDHPFVKVLPELSADLRRNKF